MQLNDNGEIVWETPAKCVTDLYRTSLYQHLMRQMDKHLQPENSNDQTSGD